MDCADFDAAFFETARFPEAYSQRLRAMGWFQNRMMVAVIFRSLGLEAVAIVSMRPASAVETRVLDV